MEPISMALMTAAGIGISLFGASKSSQGAEEFTASQKQQIQLEQQVEGQRRVAMELDAKRRGLENFRKVRQAQALGLASAVNQGAGIGGSGLAGGRAQATAQGAWNQAGISQNLEIGENIFGINAKISEQKIAQANAGLKMQQGQAISSFGNQLTSSAGAFGRLTSGFGGGFGNPTSPGPYQAPVSSV